MNQSMEFYLVDVEAKRYMKDQIQQPTCLAQEPLCCSSPSCLRTRPSRLPDLTYPPLVLLQGLLCSIVHHILWRRMRQRKRIERHVGLKIVRPLRWRRAEMTIEEKGADLAVCSTSLYGHWTKLLESSIIGHKATYSLKVSRYFRRIQRGAKNVLHV